RAGIDMPWRDLGGFRDVGSAFVDVGPACEGAVCRKSAGARAEAKRRRERLDLAEVAWDVGLPVLVTAPAHDLALRFERAGMPPACGDFSGGAELGRDVGLAEGIVAPAEDVAVELEGAGVPATR